jgi:endonuclease-3 related protein
MAMRPPLEAYYRALLRRFGPRGWWPAETPFEVMVGAILTQNTAWTNVEKAILNLKALGLLDPRRLQEVDAATLAAALRPAGYYNVKAKRLKSFIDWFMARAGGDAEKLRGADPTGLREELLEVRGIGRETADSILLYALGVPVFVVDAYTHRVLSRHGLVPEEGATYEEMQELFEKALPRDVKLYNEFHALIVTVGKEFCRPRPRCDTCPLRRYLPGQ